MRAVNTPTSYPDINRLLDILLKAVQEVLGTDFVGMYLDGSLAGGDFDQDSDIDYLVVTDEAVSEEQFTGLQAMHTRLAAIDSVWAIQLEGFYVSRQALRQYDPQVGPVPNIERGRDERLKMVELDRSWDIHRSMLLKQGIRLAGPAPQNLIDAVSTAQLKQATRIILSDWFAKFILRPNPLSSRGYQSYTVLSICRILNTLAHGGVVSKKAAARWAQRNLKTCWSDLIENAWHGRHNPGQHTSPEELQETIEFIRFALESTH